MYQDQDQDQDQGSIDRCCLLNALMYACLSTLRRWIVKLTGPNYEQCETDQDQDKDQDGSRERQNTNG